MSRTAGEPRPLRQGLELFLKHLGSPPVDVVAELSRRWEEIVGPGLIATTKPIEVIDGVLVIGCTDAAWASQIGWMESQIKDRFALVFPEVHLDRVTARVTR